MYRIRVLSIFVIVFILFACLSNLPAARASQKKLPAFILMGVNPRGAMLNALGNGLAKLISEKGPFDVKLRSTSGFLDKLVNDGDVNISMGVSVESHQASHGLEHYKGRPQKKVRLVASGPPLVIGFLVKKDAPFQSAADLKGKKITGKYPGTKPIYWDGVAMLATVDMTWDDVNVIPVGDLNEGVQSFIQGRAEATLGAMRTGMIREADATLKGVRFLTLPGGPEAAEKMWKAVPGCYTVRMKSGSALGVDRDMTVMAKDLYVIAGLDTAPEVIYEVTKAMWNDMKTLHSVHPLFRMWTHKSMIKPNITIPYHEGAVRWYKEVGEWNSDLEAAQNRLVQGLK